MSDRFLKLMMSDETNFLQENFPNAFLLLIQISKFARRTSGGFDGLEIGDSIIGEIETSKKAGITRKEYRNSFEKLEELKFIETVYNPKSKKPQKRAIKGAIRSKVVNIINSMVCDINVNIVGDQKGEGGANKGRQSRMNKKEEEYKEDHHPYPSSKIVAMSDKKDEGLTDDFSLDNSNKDFTQHNMHYQDEIAPPPTLEVIPGVFLTQDELNQCIAIKGSYEAVVYAIEYIQNHPKRKHPIKDWVNALTTWVIKDDIKPRLIENENTSKRLEKLHENAPGWRCQIHVDKKKDQKGILFYNSTPTGNSETIFIPHVDIEFKDKVTKTLRDKRMQQGRFSQS